MTTSREEPKRHAPATQRNREPIADMLREALPESGLVLEIASGSGEHAVHFARRFPKLTWQPSDPDPAARASIVAWADEAALRNLRPPLELDAANDDWPVEAADAILCINMAHISLWAATLGLVAGAARLLPPGGSLILYGPFSRRDEPLAPSNAEFDRALRARDPEWGLRDLDEIAEIARHRGLRLNRIVPMPANNLSAIFRK